MPDPTDEHANTTPCQVVSAAATNRLTCDDHSGAIICERLDPHDATGHWISDHTIRHALAGNGYPCSAIATGPGSPRRAQEPVAISDAAVEAYRAAALARALSGESYGAADVIRAGLAAALLHLLAAGPAHMRRPAGTCATDPAANAFYDAYGWANINAVQDGLSGWPREAVAIRAGLDAALAAEREALIAEGRRQAAEATRALLTDLRSIQRRLSRLPGLREEIDHLDAILDEHAARIAEGQP